jgi:hypothetical protein
MEQLRRTSTQSAIESEGVAFGLSGNLVVPIAGAGMVSAVLATVVFDQNPNAGLMEWGIVILPTLLTAAYIVLLKNNRKPRFERDFWEEVFEGKAFHVNRRRRRFRHPLHAPKTEKA